MSTDPVGARHPAAREFARRLLGATLALALTGGVLAVVVTLQGPKLERVVVDPARAVVLAGQRLTLQMNQEVVAIDADSLEVEPAAAAEASIVDGVVSVRFERPLAAGTEYLVRLGEVRGAAQPASAAVETRFTTPAESAYVLERRTGRDDAVVAADAAGRRDVLTAPRIQEFARTAEITVAVVLGDDDRTSLAIAGARDEANATLAVPDGTIRQLRGSATNPVFGYVLSSTAPDGSRTHTLSTVDVSGVAPGSPRPALGPGGEPLTVVDWAFVPGTASLVAQDETQSLFLVDTLGVAPVAPLGVHAELRGFVPGTQTLVVADPDGGSTIDLAGGATAPLRLANPDAPGAHPGVLALLDDAGDYVISLMTEDERGVIAARGLARVDADGATRLLFAPAAPGGFISGFCLAPNGLSVAVETVGASGTRDGYPNAPGFTESTTTVVDVRDGTVRFNASGAASSWCAG